MVESSDFSGSSFIILINDDDFVDKLKLPSRALKKQGKSLIITLRASHIPGRKWPVSVERHCGGLFFTGDGWKAFTNDVDLKLGEYLLFNGTGDSEFVVSVYEITGCKREITSSGFDSFVSGDSPAMAISISSEDEVEDKDDDEDEDEDEDEDSHFKRKKDRVINRGFSFVKKLTKFCIAKRLDIPRSCINEAGIKKTMNIHFRNTNGSRRLWPVTLRYATRWASSISSGGWRYFVRNNDINAGDKVRFTFKPSENVMEVKVLKTTEEEEEESL